MLDGHDYEDNWNYELFEIHMKIEWGNTHYAIRFGFFASFFIYKGILV